MAPDSTRGTEIQLEVHGLAGQQYESCPLSGDDNSSCISSVVVASDPVGNPGPVGYEDPSDSSDSQLFTSGYWTPLGSLGTVFGWQSSGIQ